MPSLPKVRPLLWTALLILAFWAFWTLVNLALGDGFPGALEVAGKAVGAGVAVGLAFYFAPRLYRRFAKTSWTVRPRGPVWGLAVFGLFVWFVFSASWMAYRGGLEGLIGAILFFLWVAVVAALIERRRRRI